MAIARRLIVEIHDISPLSSAETTLIAQRLDTAGVGPVSLLVVPAPLDRNGARIELSRSRSLVRWLRERQAAGDEIVQHGLTHRAPSPPPPGLRNAFMHHVFSRGCDEFAHLDHDTAKERLSRGRAILHDCRLRPRGFIAPAWQQSAGALRALAQLEYDFTAFFRHIRLLKPPDVRLPSPVLTFDAPNAWVDHGKRATMRCIESAARDAPLLRVALHPAVVHNGRLLDHIVRRIDLLRRRRQLTSYTRLLAQHERQARTNRCPIDPKSHARAASPSAS